MPWSGEVPRVSIVVVTFNQLACTKLCLTSVLTNTDAPAYELIVVDNASSDGTQDYLRELAAVHPHVRVLCNDQNLGYAPANNQGLAMAAGEVLVLLNNDTIVTPGWLTTLAGHLDDPLVGAVGPVTNRICNEAQIEASYDTYGELLRFAAHRSQVERGAVFDIRMLAMFCLAMRRDVYDRVGPIDERFAVGMLEDDDYSMRLRAAGHRVVCAEDVFIHHFGGASFGELVPTGAYGELLRANQERWEAKWGMRWEPYQQRTSAQYVGLVDRVRATVQETLPPDATVLVVSKGDDELIRLDGRRAHHFPQGRDGGYAGFHPADSGAAIAHLEELRSDGADYLLFPKPALWWLDHYEEFRRHLEEHCRPIPMGDDVCLAFGLEPERAAARE